MKFKKLFVLLVMFIMIIPTVLFAQTCNDDLITIESISMEEKDDSITELSQPTVTGKTISLNLKMNTVGDSIIYKLVVKNDSQEDYEFSNTPSNQSDYVVYTYSSNDNNNIITAGTSKTLYLKAEYKKEVPSTAFSGGTFVDNKNVQIDLTTEPEDTNTNTNTNTNIDTNTNNKDDIVNPKTGTGATILFIIVTLFVAGILYIIFNKNKTIRHLVIIISLTVILPLTIYAACSCRITIESSVTFEYEDPSVSVESLKSHVVTSGDGLYRDTNTTNRYVFKGENPNNYIKIENSSDLYRIISIEPDNSLKVIKETSIGTIPYDLGYTSDITGVTAANSLERIRTGGSNDLCYAATSQGYVGCKAWGDSNTTYQMVNNTETKVITFPKGQYIKNLPGSEAYLNAYLNGGMYSGSTIAGWFDNYSGNIKRRTLNHNFYIGPVNNIENQTTNEDINQESDYFWKGYVGIMNTSDYVNASSNPECKGIYDYVNINTCYNNSKSHNYLSTDQAQWTLNSVYTGNSKVWSITQNNILDDSQNAQESLAVRPVLYISSLCSIEGNGTKTNPYQLSYED